MSDSSARRTVTVSISRAPRAIHFTVFGADLAVARLEDIMRSKIAADRPRDRQDVLILREMLARRRAEGAR